MYIEQFFIEGLGCASYLIGCESDGLAVVVDPDRDVRKYLQAAEQRGMKITDIIETHLHADHVSGNTELAALSGARIHIHAEANAEFAHQPLHDGDILWFGKVKINVMHTPGHTPESVTLLVSDTTRTEEPWMALTGDLLFVGDIGRPDLVGPDAAHGLAEDLQRSLFDKLLRQDDRLMIFPGHGSGSLCGRNIGSVRSTTLGYERQFNQALAVGDKEQFVEAAVANLPQQPGNHHSIKTQNRKGPARLGDIAPRPLSIVNSIPHFQRGAALLDLRRKRDYVARHVHGSAHLEADEQLGNRIGFVLEPRQPIILLLSEVEVWEAAVYNLARVGFENIVGYLDGGIEAWERYGLPVTSGDIVDVGARDLFALLQSANGDRPVVLDVRELWEYTQGHIPGAVLIPLGQLGSRLNELDQQKPVAVVCASGSRSLSAAALLGSHGYEKIYNLQHGMHGWTQAGLEISMK